MATRRRAAKRAPKRKAERAIKISGAYKRARTRGGVKPPPGKKNQ